MEEHRKERTTRVQERGKCHGNPEMQEHLRVEAVSSCELCTEEQAAQGLSATVVRGVPV